MPDKSAFIGQADMFDRVYTSTNPYEWWNKHLADALGEFVAVAPCQAARHGRPGQAIDTWLPDLLQSTPGTREFYLGSWDQIFRGIAELDMPTAIWTDFIAKYTLGFLPCLRLYDVIFCTQKDSVEYLRGAGLPQVEWLPFAYDARLRNDSQTEKIYDVAFVGSLDMPATRKERLEILSALEGRFKLNDFRQPVFGDAMMAVYNRSRMAVNVPWEGGFNMRTFEVMATGAMLFTKDVGNGQRDLFKDGVHFVSYEGPADLIAKIDYYLAHEDERRAIAAAAHKAVTEAHSYRHRAQAIVSRMERAERTRTRIPAERASAYEVYYNYIHRSDLLAALAFSPRLSLPARLRLLARSLWQLKRQVTSLRKAPL